MGGRHSQCIVYQKDPALLAQLEQQRAQLCLLQQQLEAIKKEAERRQDPLYYRQNQEELLERFLETLKNQGLHFQSVLDPQIAHLHNVLVIGDVSCGKSSLLNCLFDLQLKAGRGHTTTDISPVYHADSCVVWDSPGGNNEAFAFYDPDTLNFIHSVSLVVVLYETSLITVKNIVRVCAAIKGKSLVVARTKCDLFHPGEASIDDEMQKDIDVLRRLHIGDVQVFTTSALGKHLFENQLLRNAMCTA